MAELHLLSPAGFRAAGVYGGIKSRRGPDVGLLVCDTVATAAAVFTTNKVVAAPVVVGREHIAAGRLRAIVVNAGNANACTGRQGMRDARRMCALAAEAVGCTPELVLCSSTGIIGRLLPMEKVTPAIRAAGTALGSSAEHARLFGAAILTTDLRSKSAATRFRIGRRTVTLAGVCKGSGMIGPRMALDDASDGRSSQFGPTRRTRGASGSARGRTGAVRRMRSLHATMLAYLATDVAAPAALLRRMLGGAVEGSFNAVTVDDHASTNDTAAILASGATGAGLNSDAARKTFAAALDDVCRSLAYQIAADGEGATKVVIVHVRGAGSDADARLMARAIANSPLVKCAMHGNDPNWGRIVSAAGMTGAAFDPQRAVLHLQGVTVFRKGQPIAFDASKVSSALAVPEVRVELDCRLGKSDAMVWTCDLSKQYVTINADYHT